MRFEGALARLVFTDAPRAAAPTIADHELEGAAFSAMQLSWSLRSELGRACRLTILSLLLAFGLP